MNDDILRAIESLCDDIATDTRAEDNSKRADAILTLARSGKLLPDENFEDCAENNYAVEMCTEKSKLPKSGEHFKYNGMKFVVLGEEQSGVLAVAESLLENTMFFDDHKNSKDVSKNDWCSSLLRKYLNSEYLQQFNRGDLLPFVSDLIADDGTKCYGTSKDYIFILSCDLYRKYREFIPRFSRQWWTLTPVTCDIHLSNDICIIRLDCLLSSDDVRSINGVAPACLFSPKVFE